MSCQNKLALGTVQFGLNYGINNPNGQTTVEEVEKILRLFETQNDALYDTAILYGNSQEVLGKVFKSASINSPTVVSKFTPAAITPSALRQEIQTSLEELGIPSLYGFIAHNAKILFDNISVYQCLESLKQEGLVKKVGVSVYFPEEIEQLISLGVIPDLIQIPFNVFDKRFFRIISLVKRYNIEVHTRSVFMQGLIFKPTEFFQGYFETFVPIVTLLKELSQRYSCSVEVIALGFALRQSWITRVLIGVDSVKQLERNIALVNKIDELSEDNWLSIEAQITRLKVVNESVLLPYNWPK